MKPHHLILLCALPLFLGSCKSSTAPNTDSTTLEQILPISVGNYWVLHNLEYNNDGSLGRDYVDTLSITGMQVFNGHSVYVSVFSDVPDETLIYFSGSDLYTVRNSSTNSIPLLTFRYPMNVDESVVGIDTTLPDGSRSELLVILHGKNESVLTPKGIFSCYDFENITLSGPTAVVDTTTIDEYLLSPGVGLVQEKHYYKTNGVMKLGSIASLTAYVVK